MYKKTQLQKSQLYHFWTFHFSLSAPQNAGGFTKSGQDESSITLQWNKINSSTSFVLQFSGTQTNINAPDGDGPVIHIVSSLTAGTKYTFTLFSVFEGIKSSGVQLTAVTGKIFQRLENHCFSATKAVSFGGLGHYVWIILIRYKWEKTLEKTYRYLPVKGALCSNFRKKINVVLVHCNIRNFLLWYKIKISWWLF